MESCWKMDTQPRSNMLFCKIEYCNQSTAIIESKSRVVEGAVMDRSRRGTPPRKVDSARKGCMPELQSPKALDTYKKRSYILGYRYTF